MRRDNRGLPVGMALLALALCGACGTRALPGFAPGDGSVDDANIDAIGEGDLDSTPPVDGGAAQDSTIPASDTGASDDSTAQDAGVADANPVDTGAADTSTSDGSTCSAGGGADYQATCTSCSISASCLLTCASCTTDSQMQNANPSLQLPCPGTMSVQNTNGVLTCS
jgi:hypothetical protein